MPFLSPGRIFLFAGLIFFHSSLFGEVYEVTTGSKIVYRVEHPLHEVVGVSEKIYGEFQFSLDKPDDLSGFVQKGIEVEWKSFSSGNRNRDANVIRAVDGEHFPKIGFRFLGLEDFKTEQGKVSAVVKGALYIKGSRREVTVPVEVDLTDRSSPVAEGNFTIRMTDFGIDPPSLLFLKTKDEVRIEFAIRLRRKE
jgi:polyisoprenoid-binding protein YceI